MLNIRTMKRALVFAGLFFLAVAVSTPAEAVVGRGRSSTGSRGSRGWSQPYRRAEIPPSRGYRTTPNNESYRTPPPSGGGFLRSLGAGIAGGFLGSALFRLFGGGGLPGMGGGGGFGLLELLLLAGVAFFAFRWFQSRQVATAAPVGDLGSPRYASEVPAMEPSADERPEEVLAATEPGGERAFCEARLDDFFRLQAAFGNRDLAAIRSFLAPEIAPQIEADIEELKRLGQINRMENIAVRSTELVDAWREPGRLYATVRYDANVVDYTVDERTGEVVSGDSLSPAKFCERWTFVKETGFGKGNASWRLSAIERELA